MSGGLPEGELEMGDGVSSPSLKCAAESTHLRESQQVGHLFRMHVACTEIFLREFAPKFIEYELKRRPLVLQPAPQGTRAHVQGGGSGIECRNRSHRRQGGTQS
jgi:hypothetical protein